MFPKVPQSSRPESLGFPTYPPLEHPGTLRNPTKVEQQQVCRKSGWDWKTISPAFKFGATWPLFRGLWLLNFQGVRVLFELFHTRNWIIKIKLSNMIFLSTKTTVVMYTAYIFGWGIRFLNVFFEKKAF